MAIWISSLALAPSLVQSHRPSRVVSLLSPYDDFPAFADIGPDRHLKVAIHDIVEDVGDWRAPGRADADRIIEFVGDWDRTGPMLVHCWAGISRSTATAFIAACMHNPGVDEEEIAWAIRKSSPTASPNARLVEYADASLERGGRMLQAVKAIGRGDVCDSAKPFSIPSRYKPAPRP